LVACSLHNKARGKEPGKFCNGEVDLEIFWSKYEASDTDIIHEESGLEEEEESTRKSKIENGRKYQI
jgi:hypothetical protein